MSAIEGSRQPHIDAELDVYQLQPVPQERGAQLRPKGQGQHLRWRLKYVSPRCVYGITPAHPTRE